MNNLSNKLFVLTLVDKIGQTYGEWHYPERQLRCLRSDLFLLIDDDAKASAAVDWCEKASLGEKYVGDGFEIKVLRADKADPFKPAPGEETHPGAQPIKGGINEGL